VTSGAVVAVIVLAGAGTALGIWLTRSDSTTHGSRTKSASVPRDPTRFQMRPVLAVGSAPCSPGQFPGRAQQGGNPSPCYTLGPVALDGRAVAYASMSTQTADGAGVDLQLTAKGMDTFNGLAANGFGKPAPLNQIALILDGTVESAPQFNEPHFDGNAVRISGNFTDAEARRAATIIAPPTPTTTSPTFPAAPSAITKPCRYFTLGDARAILGPSAVDDNADAPTRNSTCTYTTAAATPVSGAPVDVAVHPSLSVQLWHGRLPLPSTTGSSIACPACIPTSVHPIAGLGDGAAWYQLAPDYQVGPFPSGNLDVQVGGTAMRVTVNGVRDAQGTAVAAARVLVPKVRT
jgi:SecD-like export protein